MFSHLGRYLDALGTLVLRDTADQLNEVDAIFFSHDVDRGEKVEGRAWSRVEDPIAAEWRELGLSEARIAHAYSRLGGQRAHGAPVLINRAVALNRLSSQFQVNTKETIPARTRMYARLLRRTSPMVVFTIGLPPALACAARSLNIPVVELLHGKGYSSIPWGWAEAPQEHLPNTVVAFDAVSARTFQGLESRGVKTIYAEDPWIKRFRDDPSPLPSEWQWPRNLSDGCDRVVLVSLQWEGGTGHFREDQSANLFENTPFLQTLESVLDKTANDTLWLFRLHPVQLRQSRYAWMHQALEKIGLERPNIEWQHASTLPLPAVLQVATHHMSMRSGSTYEAAMMGVPSALLCPSLNPGNLRSNKFHDLREVGYARLLPMEKDYDVLDWLTTAKLKNPFTSGAPIDVQQALQSLAKH